MVLADDALRYPTDRVSKIAKASRAVGLSIWVILSGRVIDSSSYVCENVGKVGDEGEKSLEDVEVYVDTMRNAVIHCLDDVQDAEKEMARKVMP